MKKTIAIILSLILTICIFAGCDNNTEKNPTEVPITSTPEPTPEPTSVPIEGVPNQLVYPEDNTVFSLDFAQQVFYLNLSSSKKGFVTLANYFGFTNLLGQGNFNKKDSDTSHTCGYTVSLGSTTYKGEKRSVVLVQLSATQTMEWTSNLDFAPSHDNDTLYSENFYLCAQDVWERTISTIKEISNPLILTTGYSRGAAVGNILGTMFNKEFGEENCFTYTFATPNTIRYEENQGDSKNIFNIVNKSDMISLLPPSELGFHHAGTDYFVQSDEEIAALVSTTVTKMASSVSSIEEVYTVKYSMEGPGIDEVNGTTVMDILQDIAKLAPNIGTDSFDVTPLLKYMFISPESQLAPLVNSLVDLLMFTEDIATVFNQHSPVVYGPLLGIDLDVATSFLSALGLPTTVG